MTEIDPRGIPASECINCGSNVFNIIASFNNYQMEMYWLEGTCYMCDTPLTIPTPCDHPNWNPETKEIEEPPLADYEQEYETGN